MAASLNGTGVTFSDGTVQPSAYPGTKGQVVTSTGTFTIPTGITALKVTVVGGGGGGANATGSSSFNPSTGEFTYSANIGRSGSGGGVAIKYLTSLVPGNTLTVTIGAGGSSNASGGTSSVASGTQTISTVSATGGGTGGASGGLGSGGDLNFYGYGVFETTAPGGGTAIGGRGGNIGSSSPSNGSASTVYGCGGGGAYSGGTQQNYSTTYYGGAGSAGVVIFEW